jgi:hypothetical protein
MTQICLAAIQYHISFNNIYLNVKCEFVGVMKAYKTAIFTEQTVSFCRDFVTTDISLGHFEMVSTF